MIYVNLNIKNPFWWNRFKVFKTYHGKTPFKHKNWEVEILKLDNLLRFEFELSIRQDHSGANLELALFGYEIHFTFYDDRHWDYDKNCWENYD